MSAKKKEQNESLVFEKSLERMEQIVEKLEGGDVPLDQSIQLFEEGKTLGKKCAKHLTEIEKKVLKIIDKDDGEVQLEPFETGDEES